MQHLTVTYLFCKRSGVNLYSFEKHFFCQTEFAPGFRVKLSKSELFWDRPLTVRIYRKIARNTITDNNVLTPPSIGEWVNEQKARYCSCKKTRLPYCSRYWSVRYSEVFHHVCWHCPALFIDRRSFGWFVKYFIGVNKLIIIIAFGAFASLLKECLRELGMSAIWIWGISLHYVKPICYQAIYLNSCQEC